MTIFNKQSANVAAKQAVALLQNFGCLDALLEGKPVNAKAFLRSGGTTAKKIRDAVNTVISAHYSNGLSRTDAAKIDFNRSEVSIQGNYLDDFNSAVQHYRGN